MNGLLFVGLFISVLFSVVLESKKSESGQLPMLCFLGTSSAVPSKYRNVSGYLLRISENSNVLIDCGEGTYGL